MILTESSSIHPADATPIAADSPGYSRLRISFCLVIGARGQLVAVQDLFGRTEPSKAGMSVMVPHLRRPSGKSLTFLWDRQPAALPEADKNPAWLKMLWDRHQLHGRLHRTLLEGVNDTPLLAFLRFLDEWTPELVARTPGWMSRAGENYGYRFQYDDEFLHERHVARLAWDRAYPTFNG